MDGQSETDSVNRIEKSYRFNFNFDALCNAQFGAFMFCVSVCVCVVIAHGFHFKIHIKHIRMNIYVQRY